MSELDRDLRREAALRANFRVAGCPDPKCGVCGEAKVWRLAFKAGRPPLCRNCLADRQRNPASEAARRAALAKARFADPRCVVCGDDKIWRLQMDHIAGRKHDKTCALLCANCHEDHTFMQRQEPKGGDDPRNVLEVIGRWMLGLAELFELIGKKLYEFGEYLLNLAERGYGGELKFPERI